ncbi:hypothetical protein DHB64_06495 [Antarcticibacterium sp. W02-3]|nr:hypothetical protein [Antarcticibacterium sp. W02-3]
MILWLFFSCSQEESQIPIPTPANSSANIETVTPHRLKIGDTLSIKGENLKKINKVKFEYDQRIYDSYDVEIFSRNFVTYEDELIEVIIPTAVHENLNLMIGEEAYPIELVGFIPLSKYFPSIQQFQTTDEKTGFVLADKKLYRSTDGFYTWTTVIEYNQGFPDTFFFLNEDIGWLVYHDPYGGPGLYFTNNGRDFELMFRIEQESHGNVRKVYFLNENMGYLINDDGTVLVIENGIPVDLYEYYPQLKNPDISRIDVYDLTAVSKDLLFLAPNDREFLVKIENGNVSYSPFNIWPLAPQLFGNVGYLQANSDIYKTEDQGSTWNKIKTYENYYPQIWFYDQHHGMAFVNYNEPQIFETRDGGETWHSYPVPATVNLRTPTSGTSNFFTGYLGKFGSGLTKYIKE